MHFIINTLFIFEPTLNSKRFVFTVIIPKSARNEKINYFFLFEF